MVYPVQESAIDGGSCGATSGREAATLPISRGCFRLMPGPKPFAGGKATSPVRVSNRRSRASQRLSSLTAASLLGEVKR